MALKDILIGVAISGMPTAGNLLKAKDTNNTGADDVIGNLLVVGSGAATQYLSGDVHGLNGSLKTIRDSIDAYLTTQT